MFVGRAREIKFFEDRYKAREGQLIVLYGRRRVGKTELLYKFCEGKPHVFYSCRELADSSQIEAFTERMSRSGVSSEKHRNAIPDWEAAFKMILDLPTSGEKKLLIIDEFQYMCKSNPSIPSILQILWDELLGKRNVMIVLCGSAMGFIENSVLSEKNPLYGRATGIYKMTELPFDDAIKFFPNYSDEDKFLAYAVLGGIPHYLRQFDPERTLRENIIANVLEKGCILYNEVEFLMRQELREPALYNTLLETIAFGSTQLGEIHTKSQVDKSKVSVYIKNLVDLQILEREFSVFESGKRYSSSTRGLYRVTDNYFRFWFSFVFPNLSDLESGGAEDVFTFVVQPYMNSFASPVFEKVCREYIRRKSRDNGFPFRVSKLGRWWGKQTVSAAESGGRTTSVASEIDIVAIDDQSKNYILGECKFRNSEMDTADLTRLKGKAFSVDASVSIIYALFSKSGFTEALIKKSLQEKDLLLFSLGDIVGFAQTER